MLLRGTSDQYAFKRGFNLSCGRVVYRVEKSKVLMEDTRAKDLDLRLFKRSFSKSTCDLCHYASKQFHNISVVPLLLQRESLSGE
jgi:hypothetical protein